MSDTENKTESATETSETAPYMKKDSQDKGKTKSTKSNIIMPLVLLLVSAIVIVATFYREEYNTLLAETGTQKNAATNAIAEIDVAETAVAEKNAVQDHAAVSIETMAEKAETVDQTETTDQNITTQTEKTSPADEVVATASVEKTIVATAQAQPANNHALAQRAYAPYQYNTYDREQAQASAKQHMKMLQQRRQTYEREMQDRRAQYEAAMKSRQEKRANIAEAQKAVYQRAQKNRMETSQKIQKIHNQISKLHEEIHQIMRESVRTAAAPIQMQSM